MKDEEQTNPLNHKEDWDFYFTDIDNKPGSITLDLGLAGIAPIPDQKNVCCVSIKMLEPRTDGLSSNSESKIIGDIEGHLAGIMVLKHYATYVGRATSDGYRHNYFYIDDITLVDKTISDLMMNYPKYFFYYGTKEDETWSVYFDFLYPLPHQLLSIQNRRVIDLLEKNGDDVTEERPVDHWIYFKTETDKQHFWDRIKNEGFEIVTDHHNESFGDKPYSLRISRIDKVDQESVDEYVIHLKQLADECNGHYDGWETSIELD